MGRFLFKVGFVGLCIILVLRLIGFCTVEYPTLAPNKLSPKATCVECQQSYSPSLSTNTEQPQNIKYKIIGKILDVYSGSVNGGIIIDVQFEAPSQSEVFTVIRFWDKEGQYLKGKTNIEKSTGNLELAQCLSDRDFSEVKHHCFFIPEDELSNNGSIDLETNLGVYLLENTSPPTIIDKLEGVQIFK